MKNSVPKVNGECEKQAFTNIQRKKNQKACKY